MTQPSRGGSATCLAPRSSTDYLRSHLVAEKRTKRIFIKLMDSQAQLKRTHGHHQAEEPIRIHHQAGSDITELHIELEVKRA